MNMQNEKRRQTFPYKVKLLEIYNTSLNIMVCLLRYLQEHGMYQRQDPLIIGNQIELCFIHSVKCELLFIILSVIP